MSTNLISMCSAQNIPYPTLYGAEFLSLSASVVTNYSSFAPDFYNFNHPNITVKNASFCNITVSYTHPGENDKVYVEAWLPLDGWNERLQATGGAGWIAGRYIISYFTMDGAIGQGYATVTTDGGLGNAQTSAPWALLSPGNVNMYALQNLGSVSLNDQAIIGKSLVKSFYGKPPKYSYFSGCSQGGRQGFMLAQRYPDAYDGIAASAPAINWNELVMNFFYPSLIMNLLGEYPANCEFDAIRAAAIGFCDPLDGVVDGVISSLYHCPFDPYSVVGKRINCSTTGTSRLVSKTAALVASVTWGGARSANNSFLWYGMNYDTDLSGSFTNSGYALDTTQCASNGTCGPYPNILPSQWIQLFIEKNPNFDASNITREKFDELFHAGNQQFGDIINANDPDLTEFQKKGGKLISYHGFADSTIPPGGSRQYYDQVTKLIPNVHNFYRLFESPGLGHCAGGNGGQPTTAFDALRAWVENGTAPQTLPVSFNGSNGVEYHRNICAYPLQQVYNRHGDPTLASSFSCI